MHSDLLHEFIALTYCTNSLHQYNNSHKCRLSKSPFSHQMSARNRAKLREVARFRNIFENFDREEEKRKRADGRRTHTHESHRRSPIKLHDPLRDIGYCVVRNYRSMANADRDNDSRYVRRTKRWMRHVPDVIVDGILHGKKYLETTPKIAPNRSYPL